LRVRNTLSGTTFSPVNQEPNTQLYRPADGQTDDIMMPITDHTV